MFLSDVCSAEDMHLRGIPRRCEVTRECVGWRKIMGQHDYRRVQQDCAHSEIILELISVLIAITLLIVFGLNLKSVIRYCFGDKFPGCVKIPPLRLDVPFFGITLTLQKLHLHS